MKFEDDRIVVAMNTTPEDSKKADNIAYSNGKATRILILLGLLVFAALAVLCAVSCVQGDDDAAPRVFRFGALAAVIGLLLYYYAKRPAPDNGDKNVIRTVAFCRNGMFPGAFQASHYIPYENINKCIETDDLLYFEFAIADNTRLIDFVPARFLSHEDAQKITSVLKEKCGRKYKLRSRLAAADHPERVKPPKWAKPDNSLLGDKLYELEYTLSAHEAEQISLMENEHQRAVKKRRKTAAAAVASIMLLVWVSVILMETPEEAPGIFIFFTLLCMFVIAVMSASIPLYRARCRKSAMLRLTADMQYGSRFVLYENRAVVRIGGDEHLIRYSPAISVTEEGEYTIITLPQVRFGWFAAIAHRVLDDHPEFTQILTERLDCHRRKLRAVTGRTKPLRKADGRGRVILQTTCGGINVSMRKRSGMIEFVADGKVYAEHKSASDPVHLKAKVDGIRFNAIYDQLGGYRIIADDIEIARREKKQQ